MENKDEQLTYEELTALCKKQEEYINELEGQTKASLEVPKPDLDELIANNNRLYDKIRELEEVIRALLYALRKTNVERLVNDDESRHFQEMYAKEHERANKLFEKLNDDK